MKFLLSFFFGFSNRNLSALLSATYVECASDGMALNVFAAIRQKSKSRHVIVEADTENLLDNLVSKLPPRDTWDAEFFLGILVLGYVAPPLTEVRQF
jgi:hypothetical protein